MPNLLPIKPRHLTNLPPDPRVSVLIANFNYATYVGRAIESVQRQTYQNFEIIVCDDGSTDNSLEVITRYAAQDQRIRVICQQNFGHASALNTAFAISRGDIISILDADDEWFPDRLEEVVSFFKLGREYGFIVHPLTVVNNRMRVIKNQHPRTVDEGWLAPRILAGYIPILPPSSGLSLHREVAEIVFPLPAEFRSWADLVLAERAALLTPVMAIREPKGYYYLHNNNTTGIAGPTTLTAVRAAISRIQQLISSHVEFVKKIYGIKVDAVPWTEQRLGEIALVERLLLARKTPWSMISRSSGSTARALIWALLFMLPQQVSIKILGLWWGEWPYKPWVRRFIHLNRW